MRTWSNRLRQSIHQGCKAAEELERLEELVTWADGVLPKLEAQRNEVERECMVEGLLLSTKKNQWFAPPKLYYASHSQKLWDKRCIELNREEFVGRGDLRRKLFAFRGINSEISRLRDEASRASHTLKLYGTSSKTVREMVRAAAFDTGDEAALFEWAESNTHKKK